MFRIIFALIASAACFAQVRPTPKSQPVPPAHTRPANPAPRVSKPADQTKADAEIERDFRERLKRSKMAASGFTIRVQGGVATLEGATEVVQHKGAATRMAKAAGARAVVNRIRVGEAARAKSSENLEQGRRREQRTRGENRFQR